MTSLSLTPFKAGQIVNKKKSLKIGQMNISFQRGYVRASGYRCLFIRWTLVDLDSHPTIQ